eukprot:scaffold149930_cov29-Attheya_sp.AAC.2
MPDGKCKNWVLKNVGCGATAVVGLAGELWSHRGGNCGFEACRYPVPHSWVPQKQPHKTNQPDDTLTFQQLTLIPRLIISINQSESAQGAMDTAQLAV